MKSQQMRTKIRASRKAESLSTNVAEEKVPNTERSTFRGRASRRNEMAKEVKTEKKVSKKAPKVLSYKEVAQAVRANIKQTKADFRKGMRKRSLAPWCVRYIPKEKIFAISNDPDSIPTIFRREIIKKLELTTPENLNEFLEADIVTNKGMLTREDLAEALASAGKPKKAKKAEKKSKKAAEEDEDEEETPKSKAKKSSKKEVPSRRSKKAKDEDVDNDEEEEDEDEEETPKSKAKKAAPSKKSKKAKDEDDEDDEELSDEEKALLAEDDED